MRNWLILAALLVAPTAPAQRLDIVSGRTDRSRTAHHYLRGMTDPGARITVNGRTFPVYWTGAFAAEVLLTPGDNSVTVTAEADGREHTERFDIRYEAPQPASPVEGFVIAEARLKPDADQRLAPGDELRVQVRATPGCRATWLGGEPLYELQPGSGLYQGRHTVTGTEQWSPDLLTVTLGDDSRSVRKALARTVEILRPDAPPVMLRTVGDLPYLNYGLGEDRLGGAKISHLVPGIVLESNGRVGDLYRVRLSRRETAWIPASCVEELSPGYFRPESLVGSWSVSNDGEEDVVRISLAERLPYRTFHEVDPARVVVDLYGAVSNTSWITQYPEQLRAVERVDYRQIEDDVYRITITLGHNQHWGHSVAYSGSQLVIRIKPRPRLTLKGLHVAIDAGHGGQYTGAVGTTGCQEKEINLQLAHMLREALEQRGARTTLTREDDRDVGMTERVMMLREARPDMLVSIHCNAGGSPFAAKGTSTYYRHIGFRPLSTAILGRLLRIEGVRDFGNVGSFNFLLNSPTEYPNVLVETQFLSSPEDEARILDPKFRQQLIHGIVEGIEAYLKEAARE